MYGIPAGDDIPDYGLGDLFHEEGIQTEMNKQLVPKPLPMKKH